MTKKQEIFNLVVEGFAKQMSTANVDRGCLYRTLDGKKCAIGMLIPDELYKASIEYTSVESILSSAFFEGITPQSKTLSAIGEHLYKLIGVHPLSEEAIHVNAFYKQLQEVHDSMLMLEVNTIYPEYMNFPQRLIKFANTYSLNTDKVVENVQALTKLKTYKQQQDDETTSI